MNIQDANIVKYVYKNLDNGKSIDYCVKTSRNLVNSHPKDIEMMKLYSLSLFMKVISLFCAYAENDYFIQADKTFEIRLATWKDAQSSSVFQDISGSRKSLIAQALYGIPAPSAPLKTKIRDSNKQFNKGRTSDFEKNIEILLMEVITLSKRCIDLTQNNIVKSDMISFFGWMQLISIYVAWKSGLSIQIIKNTSIKVEAKSGKGNAVSGLAELFRLATDIDRNNYSAHIGCYYANFGFDILDLEQPVEHISSLKHAKIIEKFDNKICDEFLLHFYCSSRKRSETSNYIDNEKAFLYAGKCTKITRYNCFYKHVKSMVVYNQLDEAYDDESESKITLLKRRVIEAREDLNLSMEIDFPVIPGMPEIFNCVKNFTKYLVTSKNILFEQLKSSSCYIYNNFNSEKHRQKFFDYINLFHGLSWLDTSQKVPGVLAGYCLIDDTKKYLPLFSTMPNVHRSFCIHPSFTSIYLDNTQL